VSAAIVTGGTNVGGLVGDNGGYNQSIINSNYVDTSTEVNGDQHVGGLLGYDSGEGVITGNTVTDTHVNGNDYVGGLVGMIDYSSYFLGYSDDNHVVNSFVSGGTVSGGSYVGGLVGWNGTPITNSSVTGTIVSGGSLVGGLVGYNSGSISSSYVSGGSVTGTGNTEVGGLVGYNSGSITDTYASGSTVSGNSSVGGLVGNNAYGGTISNSYASNGVVGSGYVGGLVGGNDGGPGSVSNSFWDTTVAGVSVVGIGYDPAAYGGATGLTSTGMMTMSNFTGWSIARTGGAGMAWRIYEGHTAPLLTSFLTPLTLTGAPDITVTYNGAPQSGGTTATGGVLGAAATGTNTGFYNGYYSTQQGDDITGGNLTINPAVVSLSSLDITANDASKTYGTTLTFAGTEFTPVGLLGSDTIGSVTLTSAGAVATANVGAFAITPSNAVFSSGSAGNYTITYVNGQLTVTAAPLTVTADALSKIYGSADPALTYVASGLLFSDTLSGGLSRAAGENVGSYAINQGTLANPNYAISYTGNSLGITPATLTVAANAAGKVYGAADPALTYTAGGFQFTDNAASVLSGALSRAPGENVGSYAIGQNTLASNANYTVAYTGNSLGITPATLTYTANAASRLYGAADPAFSGSVTGFVLSDNLANATGGTASFSTSASGASNVGSYAITGSGLTANKGNYIFVQAPGNSSAFTITPATLTVTVDYLSKMLDTSDPLLTYTVSGLKLSDTAAATLNGGALVRDPGETVGAYPINQGTLGLSSANYTMTYVGATFSILPPIGINEIVQVSLLMGTETPEDKKNKPKPEDVVIADTTTGNGANPQSLPICGK